MNALGPNTWSRLPRSGIGNFLTPSGTSLLKRFHDADRKYELYAACVMPDHVHLLLEPRIEKDDADGKPVFYALSQILQTLKSISSHRINKLTDVKGQRVWENESFDRVIRWSTIWRKSFITSAETLGIRAWPIRMKLLVVMDAAASRVSREARDTAGEAPALPVHP